MNSHKIHAGPQLFISESGRGTAAFQDAVAPTHLGQSHAAAYRRICNKERRFPNRRKRCRGEYLGKPKLGPANASGYNLFLSVWRPLRQALLNLAARQDKMVVLAVSAPWAGRYVPHFNKLPIRYIGRLKAKIIPNCW